MNGIELSKGYFEEYGKAMLENDFPDILPYLAVGFVGSGSEHFGFDDKISQDHDFEPGFCVFLPSEDVVDRRTAFLLERAYSKLPKEYMGVKRQPVSPVGGNRNGIIRTADFYSEKIGSADGQLSIQQWLTLPDYALFEATGGEMFFDNYGEFTEIRNSLKFLPEDIRLKKLAGNLLVAAQAGQYNFSRCLKHKEPEAAQLACNEFINSVLKCVFLLKKEYMPYYKWSFRKLREIENDYPFSEKLAFLLYGSNADEIIAEAKYYTIEDIASELINMLQAEGLTKAVCGDLEKHAYSVNDKISEPNIRNMNIFAAV